MSDLKFPRIIAALQSALGLKAEQSLVVDTALNAELSKDQEIVAPHAPDVVEELKKAHELEIKTTVDSAVQLAVQDAEKRIHALYSAREAVSPKVGVTSLDSAEETYRFAMTKSGISHDGLSSDALPALWDATLKTGKVSHDTNPEFDFDISKIFPNASSYIRKG